MTGFDNVTFGSADPTVVPLPGSIAILRGDGTLIRAISARDVPCQSPIKV